ncbi:endo-beta-N-acetylglucosaminidase [Streptomyces rectiviolaceus]
MSPAAGRQPFMHGYDADALKHWSPRTDRWARYFRSRVPLASRIAPFPATQARPQLPTGARVMNLCNDYDGAFFTARKYDDAFARRLLRFWQYSDFYGSWHGLPVDGSPTGEPDDIVHGLINPPNPAYTDAAHRNGVKSLGCWFWPRPGAFAPYLERYADGSYPVADKLIEMAEYFGFDGYFINHEAETPPDEAKRLRELLTYLRSRAPEGFHLQWYDTIRPDGGLDYLNHLNDENAPWLESAADSFFANYWMTEAGVETSRATALRLGRDPYEAVFHGTENEQFGFDPEYDPRLVFPDSGPARTSWALFGSHFVWELHPGHEDPEAQGPAFERERQYWSGPAGDPSRTGRTRAHEPGAPDPADPAKWDGVAHHITERSVIGAFPFVTRFNTGHGRGFFLAGRRASDADWYNASIQDVLPTWQFWSEGPEGAQGGESPDFDYTRAYDGGSSLRVPGGTTARLYKTELAVRTGEESVSVTYAGSAPEVGLLFADDPGVFAWRQVGAEEAGPGWHTAARSLAEFRGRTIVTVAVRTASAVHLGELALRDGEFTPPERPEGFQVDAAYVDGESAEVFLSWHLADPGQVWYYDVHREEEWLGRIYDEVYYVKSLRRRGGEAATELALTPVAPDGTRGEPSTTLMNWLRHDH